MTFDKAAWDSGKGNYDGKNPRIGLVSDLEEAGIIVGTPRTKVYEVIGEPDRPAIAALGNAESWYLGRSDMAPDFMLLKVTFGPDDRVSRITTGKD